MAKRKLFFILTVFIVFTFSVSLISCSDDQQQTVDEEYLNSQEYSAFKKNTDREAEKNYNNSGTLAEGITELSDCSSVPELEVPTNFDWERLQKLTEGAKSCSTEQETQRLTLVGEQNWQNQTMRWFLLEYQSAYRDAEVIVATFNNKELRSFSTVGMYEKIPARHIQTNISIQNRGNAIFIRSETNRDIKYPLEQQNTIIAEYEIDAEGGINEL